MSNQERKTVIVLTAPHGVEVWGSLTRACKAHPDFKYPTISRLKFPFEHQGYTFKRVPFNTIQKQNEEI